MLNVLQHWCKSLYRKIRKRKSAKREEDRLRIPLLDEMRWLDSSKSTISMFWKKHIEIKVCFCAWLLITKIITDNFQRSGVIGNMTLEEFENACKDSGSSFVSVLDHKTDINCPADVVLENKLHQMLDQFIKFPRCIVLSCQTTNYVFISWNGLKMSSSMVTNSLNACCKRSLQESYRSDVTCSLFRKLWTTTIHQNMHQLKQNLMTHSVRVAESEYNVHNKKSTAAVATG